MTKKARTFGIIAEDKSDVDSARILIHRIANNNHIGIKNWVGEGCGRINRKCLDWSTDLKKRGCSRLILIHDLDRKDLNCLKQKIMESLNPCPIKLHLICIPIEEFEAWLLSDPEAIKTSMNLKATPNVKSPPETINSPKEHLGELIRRASGGEKIYINTDHNTRICEALSIYRTLNRCPSFVPFYNFVKAYC